MPDDGDRGGHEPVVSSTRVGRASSSDSIDARQEPQSPPAPHAPGDVVDVARAVEDRGPDLAVGDGVAVADDHDGKYALHLSVWQPEHLREGAWAGHPRPGSS